MSQRKTALPSNYDTDFPPLGGRPPSSQNDLMSDVPVASFSSQSQPAMTDVDSEPPGAGTGPPHPGTDTDDVRGGDPPALGGCEPWVDGSDRAAGGPAGNGQ